MSSSPIQNELPAHAATSPDGDASPRDGKTGADLRTLRKNPTTVRAYFIAAEVIAALMKQPRTIYDMADELGISTASVRKYVNAFCASGVVYRMARRAKSPVVFALQPSLFAHGDGSCGAPR